MPNFWLGHTEHDGSENRRVSTRPNSIFHHKFKLGRRHQCAGRDQQPSLRRSGHDLYAQRRDATESVQVQTTNSLMNLGPPIVGGTSIILNKVITDAGTSSTGSPIQQSVTFVVNGRINLFQANEIDGNTTTGMVPTQFISPASSSTSLLPGGTYLVSDVGGGVTTGQIGDIRIGGNVTNFTAMALATDLFTFPSPDASTGPQVSNFFIGGETNNVILVAPAGSRNVSVRPRDGQHHHQHRVHPEPPRQSRYHRLGGDGEADHRQHDGWFRRRQFLHPVRLRSRTLRRGELPGHNAQRP